MWAFLGKRTYISGNMVMSFVLFFLNIYIYNDTVVNSVIDMIIYDISITKSQSLNRVYCTRYITKTDQMF